jgi:hypothetical protein
MNPVLVLGLLIGGLAIVGAIWLRLRKRHTQPIHGLSKGQSANQLIERLPIIGATPAGEPLVSADSVFEILEQKYGVKIDR